MKTFLFCITIYIWNSSSILGHVGLSYPSGNEEFHSGDIIELKWFIAIDHGPCDWDLYFSPDNGGTWSEISLDIPKSQLTYDWTVPNITTGFGKIRVVQDNSTGTDYSAECRSFTIINNNTTDVTSDDNHVIKEFFIYPAYPNPFNSSTTISFSLPEKGFVSLNIFNIAGQKIKTVINGEMPAGLHKVNWNADDVNSGVYFYVIQTSQAVETRKLILIK